MYIINDVPKLPQELGILRLVRGGICLWTCKNGLHFSLGIITDCNVPTHLVTEHQTHKNLIPDRI